MYSQQWHHPIRGVLLFVLVVMIGGMMMSACCVEGASEVDVRRLLLLISEKEKQLKESSDALASINTELSAFEMLDSQVAIPMLQEKKASKAEVEELISTFTVQLTSYKKLLLRDGSITSCTQINALSLPWGAYYIVNRNELVQVHCGINNVGLSVSTMSTLTNSASLPSIVRNVGKLTFTLNGVREENSFLSKKDPSAAWNAAALSTETITKSGQLQGVSFKAGQNNMVVVVGLTQDDKGIGFNDNNYCIYLNNQQFAVFELGNAKGAFGRYEEGDEFRIYISKGQVSYARNGKVFYTSMVSPNYPMRVDVNFHTPGSRIFDICLIEIQDEAPDVINPGQALYWTNVYGLDSQPGYVKRTLEGSAWNAGASSIGSFDKDSKVGGVVFKVGLGTQSTIIGLNDVDKGKDAGDCDFGIYLHADGNTYIMDRGNAFGPLQPYFKGDNFTVQVVSGTWSVIFTHNGIPFHTIQKVPSFPLFVDVSMFNENSNVYDIMWMGGFNFTSTNAQGERAEFINFNGVINRNGIVQKHFQAGGWNGGISTAKVITAKSDIKGVSFKVGQKNMDIFIGLSNSDKDSGFVDIDFAIYLQGDGKYSVYEFGKAVITLGNYDKSDEFAIFVKSGKATCLHKGSIFYTSTVDVKYPLHVDTSFNQPNAALFDIFWVSENGVIDQKPEVILPGQPVYWKHVHGVLAKPGYQKKIIESNDWNAGSLSVDSIDKLSKIGGVTFKTTTATRYTILGLNSQGSHTTINAVDYGIFTYPNGLVYIIEKGATIGPFNKYAPNDRFDIVVSEDNTQIVYLHNGIIFYTSSDAPKFPLYVDNSLHSIDSCQFDIMWVPKHSFNNQAAAASNSVYFKNIVGMTYTEGNLVKSKITEGWDSGAFSTVSFNAPQSSTSDNSKPVSGFSFKPLTKKRLMMGLSNTDNTRSYTDIEFAVALLDGKVSIFEKGGQVFIHGNFEIGDVFKVLVSDNTIYYYQNEKSFYTSKKKITFPLGVDLSFHDPGAAVDNITFVTNNFVPPSIANVGDKIYWKDIFGCSGEPGLTFKTLQSGSWDSGVTSTHSFPQDSKVGGFSFNVGSLQLTMVGLSDTNPDNSFESISHAIYLHNNGYVYIMERGAQKGMFQSYQKGDKFSIQVSNVNNKVHYLQNDKVFYTSDLSPKYPLMVDVSMAVNGNLYNVVWIGKYIDPPLDEVKSGNKILAFTNNVGVLMQTEKILIDNQLVQVDTITKSKAGAAWDSSVSSMAKYITETSDVRGFSFRPKQSNLAFMIGLSSEDTKASFEDIQMGIYCEASKKVFVFESGVNRGHFTDYAEHDKLSIIVTFVGKGKEPKVFYLKNDMPFYTSTITPTFPLLIDMSFHHSSAGLYDLRFVNLVDGMAITMPLDKEPSANNLVQWRNVFGVSTKEGFAKRILPGAGWNAGAQSIYSITKDGEIRGISFKVGSAGTAMVGLNVGSNAGFSFGDIDFTIHLTADSKVHVYENGAGRGTFETYDHGDTFEIKINNGKINYFKDGTVFYVSTAPLSYPLQVNLSLHDAKIEIKDMKWIK